MGSAEWAQPTGDYPRSRIERGAHLFQCVPAAISILTDGLTFVKTATVDLEAVHLVSRDANSILRNVRVVRRITELADVEAYVPEGELRVAQTVQHERHYDPGWFG